MKKRICAVAGLLLSVPLWSLEGASAQNATPGSSFIGTACWPVPVETTCDIAPLISGGTWGGGISADGNFVAASIIVNPIGYYWDRGNYFELVSPWTYINIYAVSPEGNWLAGAANTLSGRIWSYRYDRKNDFWQLMDAPAPYTGSKGYGISANGSVVVGYIDKWWTPGSIVDRRAFRWTPSGGYQILPTLSNDPADMGTVSNIRGDAAFAVTPDGRKIVGRARAPGQKYRAVMWDDSGAITDLGTAEGEPGGYSFASGISDDGNVIVGASTAPNATGNERLLVPVYWRGEANPVILQGWNADSSIVQSLLSQYPTLHIAVGVAVDASADGSIIVGWMYHPDTGARRAVLWNLDAGEVTFIGGMGTKADNDSLAGDISADGRTVLGYGLDDSGNWRSFIYRTYIQDFQNLQASLHSLADDTALAVELDRGMLRDLTGMRCSVSGRSCLRFSGSAFGGGSAGGNSLNVSPVVRLSYASALIGAFRFGLGLETGHVSLARGFSGSSGSAAALWVAYGTPGRGFDLSFSVGRSWSRPTITRGEGLSNVRPVSGQTGMGTMTVGMQVGYGVALPGDSAGGQMRLGFALERSRTTRDGYSESGGDFNATYDPLVVASTVARLEFSGRLPLGAQHMFDWRFGVERDLATDPVILSGTSDIPGYPTFSETGQIGRNGIRGFAVLGYRRTLAGGAGFDVRLRIEQPAVGSTPIASIGFGYEIAW